MGFEKELEIMRKAEAAGNAFNHAAGVLSYDAETVAPEKSVEGRGRTLAYLGGLQYELFTGRELNDALAVLNDHRSEFDDFTGREIELCVKRVGELSKIPKDVYMQMIVLQDESSAAWRKAKVAGDWDSFEPYLTKMVEMAKVQAGYINPEMETYNALLNIYEEGLDMAFLDKFFGDLREGLIPLMERIKKVPQVDRSCIEQICPAEAQRGFTKDICEIMGLDMTRLALGEVEHPFTTNFNNADVRLTTHYYEDNFTDSMYTVLHEGGHCMYELNCDDKYNYTIMQGGASMGIHESQSRFYENVIGRSYEFTGCLLELARRHFPDQLAGVTHEDFYKAVNRTEPTFIRTQADELTYPFHIMIRYELEKQLFDGSLAAADAPAAWDDMYEQYLGIRPANVTEGILQDMHWSGGLFGYFPTYALGSAYGPQYLHEMLKDNPNLWDDVAAGDLSYVTGWLREHIHQYASFYPPKVLFEKVCGEFDAKYFIDYLTDKYTKVYGLE